jgi:hypothetical protein
MEARVLAALDVGSEERFLITSVGAEEHRHCSERVRVLATAELLAAPKESYMHLLPPMFTVPFFLLAVLFVVAYLGTLGFLAVWAGSPYAKRTIKCPKSDQDCEIELDRKHALLSTLEGKRELCVKTCEQWPEQADCAQACVLQIEPSPAVLARIFSQWYEGKSCARCMTRLQPEDWDHGHVAVLCGGQLVELREVPLEKLPQALVGCVPLCIGCHEQELANLPTPEMFFRYDPRAVEVLDDPKYHN